MQELFELLPGWAVAIAVVVFVLVFLERIYISGTPIVLFGKSFGPAEESRAKTERMSNAPHVYLEQSSLTVTPAAAKEKALTVLNNLHMTGIDTKEHDNLFWGYSGPYTCCIWLPARRKIAMFVAAGPDKNIAEDLCAKLKRNF